ncbi:NB-ARC domain-containing protein [Kutzneria buriramensis]|uniref:Putative ATPase n=1 Tax=Kutzneria buriramensis TaxID=1045776 RepID=A0A3E0HGB3_9PSEU|nr:tetratricopeptide repeat protein [Kutzneria buriramensis]REH44812.1 putative ATPase [Kutzneria buriramensis]
MAESPNVRNDLSGTVLGNVVQVGSLHGVAEAVERPRQLPLAIGQFTGRSAQLAALDALVPSDTVVITAMDGAAGIGKTMLAVTWAHRVQHRFPDGTLFANLRGYGPGAPAPAEEVLDGFLRALGVAADRIPVGVEAKSARFRSLLAGRRVLIVLDNAGSAEQVRPLLPGEQGAMVVVTSRDSMHGLVVTESAHRLTVDLLSDAEAVELVTRIVGSERAAEEAAAVTALVQLCGRLPLALRIAASRVAASPYNSVTGIVAELGDERSRLDVLSSDSDERSAVRAVLGWSYQRLPDDQAVLFRRLGLHAGPEFSVPAAAAVAGLDLPQARRLVEALAAAHLTEPVARDRYRCHDLLRAYAAELAERCDAPEVRRKALAGLATWYARVAWECDRVAFPGRFRLPFREPFAGPPIAEIGEALAWLDTERVNLIALLHVVVRYELDEQVMRLADGLRFLFMRSELEDAIEVHELARRAACRRRDRLAEFWFCISLTEDLSPFRRWADAAAANDRASELAAELGTPLLAGIVVMNSAHLHNQRGEFLEGLKCARRGFAAMCGTDNSRWEAVARDVTAAALNGLGRYEEARRHSEKGLALRRHVRDVIGEALAMRQLAIAWQGLGDDRKAVDVCRRAIAIGRASSYLVDAVAEPLCVMAVSLHRMGNVEEADECWREAAELFADNGLPLLAERARGNIAG